MLAVLLINFLSLKTELISLYTPDICLNEPVCEQVVIAMLIDTRALRRHQTVADDDISKPALEVFAFPVRREFALAV